MSGRRFDGERDLGDGEVMSEEMNQIDAGEELDAMDEMDELSEEEEVIARDASVSLREITADTVEDVLRLDVAAEQRQFVAGNDRSIAQAHFSKNAWFRAIYANEAPVGFVMLYDDPETATYFLWRLMIDVRYQRLGFGTQAMDLIMKHVRNRPGADSLGTSVVPGEGSPVKFYKKLGFEETGEVDDGEIVLACSLWPG